MYIISFSHIAIFQIEAMAEDVQPLLAEVRDSGLLKEVESLTRSLTQVSEDLRWVPPSLRPNLVHVDVLAG